MNGFTNAILTLLLGWLRTLLNAVWSLFSSDSGSGLLAFLRENWKLIFCGDLRRRLYRGSHYLPDSLATLLRLGISKAATETSG